MKDWKAECALLRVEIKELRDQLRYERNNREERERRDEDVRNRFKDLLVDVLGR